MVLSSLSFLVPSLLAVAVVVLIVVGNIVAVAAAAVVVVCWCCCSCCVDADVLAADDGNACFGVCCWRRCRC